MIVAAFATGIAVGLGGAWLWLVSRPLARRQRKQVMVTLKSGAAFRGVLGQGDRQVLVLSNSELIEGDDKRLPVDGEVILPWSDVRYVQRF